MKRFYFVFVLFFAIIFRLYNINWGSPFYFHPDERNIASAVSQLSFPSQMNPHFFAYGTLPIYLTYFLGIVWNFVARVNSFYVSFEKSILILRFISFFLSSLSLLLLYKVGSEIGGKKVGLFSMALAAFSVGFIQFAHFGTFETILSFLSLLSLYLLLKFIQKPIISLVVYSAIVFGALVGTKVTSITLLPIILAAIFDSVIKKRITIKKSILYFFSFGLISIIIFFATNPFTLFDFNSFIGEIRYESAVATGSLQVFYTGEFLRTIPVLFQLLYVFPFLLNPLVEILFLVAFIFLLIKDRNNYIKLTLLFFSLEFIPQAFLFAKWTRYMLPTLPFIYLIIAYFIVKYTKRDLAFHLGGVRLKLSFGYLVILVSFLFSFAFVKTVYINKDTRIEASMWMKTYVKNNEQILSESYDLGIVPFNQFFSNIELFNFYDLDAPNTSGDVRLNSRSHDSSEMNKLERKLQKADYLILPSQRILKNRIANPADFPVGNKFYSDLISNKLSYKKIYETPCDILCKITYLGDSVFNIEETASVFDRPIVYIFKKNEKKN